MPICKHCQTDSTLASAGELTCPACGLPYDLTDEDWDFDEDRSAASAEPSTGDASNENTAPSSMPLDPTGTAAEPADHSAGEGTEPMILPENDGTMPLPSDSENLAGREATIDMTHTFGGKFADDADDDFEFDDVALGAEGEEDINATTGPSDATAPILPDTSGDGSRGSDEETGLEWDSQDEEQTIAMPPQGTAEPGKPSKPEETDRLNPDATVAFLGDGSDPASAADTGFRTGAEPADGGQTIAASDSAMRGSGPLRPPALPTDDSSTGGDSGTLAAGLSGSDRAGSGTPQTKGENYDSGAGRSGTLAADGDSERRSDRVETPKPREVTGLESGQTIPRGALGQDQASQSLRPGDTHVVGPENVRLRAYRLGKNEQRGPNDFLFESGPFAGGMGVVHGSRQKSLDRIVAVKQVKPELTSESDRNKFISEAVITGQLEHPNIIPVHDLGLASDGLPFYSMKFVDGDEWEKRIKELSEEENLNILLQVSQAIAFAHSKNIIHRDLKPANVMLGGYGEVLVMDWGLAARLDGSDVPPSGTPVYMPPETALQYLDHARGKSGGKSDGKASSTRRIPPGTYSDIYLLGGLLFKIVTGRAPHRGKTTFECLKAAARNEIIKTSRRGELLDIAYKALRTEPGERHRSVAEFIDEIKAYQSHAQSNKIAKQASADLRAAEEAKADPQVEPRVLYDSFNSARYGFENALELWSGNRRAAKRLVEAKRKHAETAYEIGDLDLALTLLDPEDSGDEEMIAKVRKSQLQRKRQAAWFRTLQYGVASLLVVALGFIGLSFYLGKDAANQRAIASAETRKATLAKQEAKAALDAAQLSKGEAAVAKQEASAAQAETRAAKQSARLAKDEAKIALQEAQLAKDEAKTAKGEADVAQAEAQVAKDEAREAEQKAIEQQYAAVRNRVRSALAERGAYAAWKELREDYGPERDAELARRGSDWQILLAAVDWQREASELLTGLDQPRIATSREGQTLVVVARDDRGGATVSVRRDGEQTARWRIDTAAESIAVSPDGSLVAIADGLMKAPLLYSTDSGKLLKVRGGELRGPVTTFAFAPTGESLMTGDAATGVAEWNIDPIAGAVRLASVDDRWHADPITAVGYSPDGQVIFAADRSGTVNFWTAGQIEAAPIAYRHTDHATGSPVITTADFVIRGDEARLAYGCRDGAVYTLFFSLSGEQAFAESRFVSLRLDGAARTRIETKPDKLTPPHGGPVTGVAFAEQGRLVVSAGGPRVFVRNATTGDDLRCKQDRDYHDSPVLSLSVAADGQVVTSDEEGRILAWSAKTEDDQVRLEPHPGESRGGVAVVGVDADSGAVVVGDEQGFVRRWAAPFASPEYDRHFAGHADHRRMRAWRLAGAEPRVVTVGSDRLACVWDSSNGRLLRTIDLGGRHVITPSVAGDALIAATDLRLESEPSAIAVPIAGGSPLPLWGNDPRVSALHELVRPGGERVIAVGLRDGQFYLWGPDRGRIDLASATTRPHWSQVRAIAYDRTNDQLFTADNDGLLVRWPLAASGQTTGELNRSGPAEAFLPGDGVVRRIEVSPRGKLLVSRTRLRDTSVQLVDTRTLAAAEANGFARDGLVDASFDVDGESVLAVADGSRVVRWSVGQGWHPVAAAAAIVRQTRGRGALTGIRADRTGVLLFGDGFAQLWSAELRESEPACRIESRALPAAVARTDAGVVAISNKGRVDTWATQVGETPFAPQQTLSATGTLGVRACPAGEPGRVYLATPRRGGGATITQQNVATSQAIGTPFVVDSGRVAAMWATSDWLAVAIDEQGRHRVELFGIARGERSTMTIPARPTGVTIGPRAQRIAIVTKLGAVLYATRERGAWSQAQLPGITATAAAFTPTGDRLVIGDANGQLAMLNPQRTDGGQIEPNVVLTFDGHSERVSVLRFATLGGRPAMLSGDAAGTVLVKSY